MAKRMIPRALHQMRDKEWIYQNSNGNMVGCLVFSTGITTTGTHWSVEGRVEAVLYRALGRRLQDIELFRLRHDDGDMEDVTFSVFNEKRNAYVNKDPEPLPPVPRSHRFGVGWESYWQNYESQNNGVCRLHFAYNKNNLGGEINIQNGLADISICHSLLRNGERAQPNDAFVLFVSSNKDTGIGYRGVIRDVVILEQKRALPIHHNRDGRNTSIYQTDGVNYYHRNANCRYHLDECNMSRDSSGIVWQSGCYAHLTPFRAVHWDTLEMPSFLKRAAVNAPISKPAITVSRKIVRSLIEQMWSWEFRDLSRNITRQEQEAGCRQSDHYNEV